MTSVGCVLQEARLGGTQRPFKFCTDLLVPVAEGPSHHCPGAAFQASCELTGLSLRAWVPNRLSSLGVHRPQGTLEQFEDVVLHHLLHCGRRWEEVGGGVSWCEPV